MKCKQCGSTQFRTSRFRRSDFSRLFYFLYPVRCRTCKERYYASFSEAFSVHQADVIRHRERNLRDQAGNSPAEQPRPQH